MKLATALLAAGLLAVALASCGEDSFSYATYCANDSCKVELDGKKAIKLDDLTGAPSAQLRSADSRQATLVLAGRTVRLLKGQKRRVGDLDVRLLEARDDAATFAVR